jgi:RND superfamily putative drug exporter
MFARIGKLVVHRAWLTIGVWVVVAVAAVGLAPTLTASSDQKDFLPQDYESVQAARTAAGAFGADQLDRSMALLVFTKAGGGPLSDADSAKVGDVVKSLADKRIDKVEGIATNAQGLSPNKQVQLGQAMMAKADYGDKAVADAVRKLRSESKTLTEGTGLQVRIGGDAAVQLDTLDQQESSGLLISLGAVIVIILLLLLIFRSPIIALLPIVVIAIVSALANALIAMASTAIGLKTDASTPVILTIVLYGIGTDYLLFLLFRYRERLRLGEDRKQAMVSAVGRVGEAIACAAGVVIIAFLALGLSSMGQMRQLGPALAIAVAVTLVAGLTLVPAIVSLLGPKVFWPSKSWQRAPKDRVAGRIGATVSRRPIMVTVVSGLLMLVLAVGALWFKPNYDVASPPPNLESSKAAADMQTGFPIGAQQPTNVYLRSDKALSQAELTTFGARLSAVDGVGQVMPPRPSPDGKVYDFTILLKHNPISNEALEIAGGPLRTAAHSAAPPGTTALVGGMSSILADVSNATERDYRVIFPVAAVLIMLILALLLRSLVAPWYLMVAVGMGFVSTLGATVLLFQEIRNEAGVVASLPIIVYMFVVAIGTDYNILMVARLREEAKAGLDPRSAADVAVRQTGPAVAAAGVILAGTFAVLMLSDQSFMQQLGFSVGIGIVIAAFVMAMFFTPALTALIGRRAWWPGKTSRPVTDSRYDAEPERELASFH